MWLKQKAYRLFGGTKKDGFLIIKVFRDPLQSFLNKEPQKTYLISCLQGNRGASSLMHEHVPVYDAELTRTTMTYTSFIWSNANPY